MRDAPAWFTDAIAMQPERWSILVDGAAIECLSWGEPGLPAILLLHGVRANADWWSHIVPLLADHYHVTALSFSGCGQSDWRERYSNEVHVAEVLAVVEAIRRREAGSVILAGHSYGGRIAALAAGRHDSRLAGVAVIDASLAHQPKVEGIAFTSSLPRSLGSVDEARARFRLVPSQEGVLPYVVDHIARMSVRRLDLAGENVLAWAADPRSGFESANPTVWEAFVAAERPFAFIYGLRSKIVTPAIVELQKRVAPAGSMVLPIAGAGHHIMFDRPLALVGALRAASAALIGRDAALSVGPPRPGDVPTSRMISTDRLADRCGRRCAGPRPDYPKDPTGSGLD